MTGHSQTYAPDLSMQDYEYESLMGFYEVILLVCVQCMCVSLSWQQIEAGLDADTNALTKQPSPSSLNAELAFKGTTGPKI